MFYFSEILTVRKCSPDRDIEVSFSAHVAPDDRLPFFAAPLTFANMEPSIPVAAAERREELGFRDGMSGGLMSRTLMHGEVAQLFAETAADAQPEALISAIIEKNVLGKPTLSSRKKSLAHLRELYGLDPRRSLFRVFRYLATLDPPSLPVLALTCVYCRDPQLRASFTLIRALKVGEHLVRERMEALMESAFPGRFSAAVKRSLAQNVNACWTAAGHLAGRSKKVRTLPRPRPVTATYAMLAGYLSGLRGQRLLYSDYADLVCSEPALIPGQLSLASSRGLLGFKHAGGVVEFDFSPLLTDQERALADVTH